MARTFCRAVVFVLFVDGVLSAGHVGGRWRPVQPKHARAAAEECGCW